MTRIWLSQGAGALSLGIPAMLLSVALLAAAGLVPLVQRTARPCLEILRSSDR